MTALFILVAVNLGLWGAFVGVLVGVRLSPYVPEPRATSMATTSLSRTKTWAPRTSDRATKIGP